MGRRESASQIGSSSDREGRALKESSHASLRGAAMTRCRKIDKVDGKVDGTVDGKELFDSLMFRDESMRRSVCACSRGWMGHAGPAKFDVTGRQAAAAGILERRGSPLWRRNHATADLKINRSVNQRRRGSSRPRHPIPIPFLPCPIAFVLVRSSSWMDAADFAPPRMR